MGNIAGYINQCRVQSVVEQVIGSHELHVPASADELEELVKYLRSYGHNPVIIGSAAVFFHMGHDPASFRPTMDVDIHVTKPLPPLPPGWTRDPEAVGIASWISPSGGYVDFLQAGEELPGGFRVPRRVRMAPDSDPGFPVAALEEVLKMKLASLREKDLLDCVAIARKLGLPPKATLGLNMQQEENYDLVTLWIEARPQAEA